MQSDAPIDLQDLHDDDDTTGIATRIAPMQLDAISLDWLAELSDKLEGTGSRAAQMFRFWIDAERRRRAQADTVDADAEPIEATPAMVNCSHWTLHQLLGAVEFYSTAREVAANRPRLVRDWLAELFTIHLAWARARVKHSDPNARGNAPR